ncbi:MAG: NAD-dependent epimerase/dehydratase family protein [Formosimonas sp.]
MRIFLTGSAGCLAAALLPVLCNDPTIESIKGIDIKPTNFQHPKLNTSMLDMRDASLPNMMKNHDAVIHLGFNVRRGNLSMEERHDININGSCNVIDAAKANNIKKFINLSSVSVYGICENATEEAKTNPLPTFPYAQHKEAVERYINKHLPTAIQFRSHLIMGANAQDFLREMFVMPVYLTFADGKTPKQQVVHEKDVVSAIEAALKTDVSGIFNLAASDIIDLGGSYIAKGIEEGRRIRKFPFSVVRMAAFFGRKMNAHDLATWIEMLDTTATVNCGKAKAQLNWTPAYSVWDARKDAMSTLKT